jgi:hypothetical protein
MSSGRSLQSNTADNKNPYIFKSQRMSTLDNTDDRYDEVGIIHVTDTAGVNALRNLGSGFANFFGAKGFDNAVFDMARHGVLKKMRAQLEHGQKVCGLKIDVEQSTPEMISASAYGTLLQKSSSR